jgi:hypothetical protein
MELNEDMSSGGIEHSSSATTMLINFVLDFGWLRLLGVLATLSIYRISARLCLVFLHINIYIIKI